MQTVFIIFISLEISLPLIRLISKNEPNKHDIISLLKKLVKDYELQGRVEYKRFDQKGTIKVYRYAINEQEISVIVERTDMIEFPL